MAKKTRTTAVELGWIFILTLVVSVLCPFAMKIGYAANDGFSVEKYLTPTKLPSKEIHDEQTGRTYRYINLEGTMAIQSYVNSRNWSSDGKRFLVGSNATNAMFEYNIETEELLFLDYVDKPSGSLNAQVTQCDQIYYKKGKEFWHMNWNTKKKEKVGELPLGATGGNGLHVTNDGRYLTCYYYQAKNPEDYFNGTNVLRVIPRLNTHTEEWNLNLHREFYLDTPDYPSGGHPMMNPKDPNLIFFCHEGSTSNINDRLWVGNPETGESWVLFEQAELSNGKTGETSGHEQWGFDGEQMYFVKYKYKNNLGQSGLMRVDKDGTNREYINGDYPYWHTTVNDNGYWMAADTTEGSYKHPRIVMVNTRTYESHYLTSFESPSTEHPYQPHPQINRSGNKIKWQMTDENGVLGIAYMDVSDIMRQGVSGGKVKVADDVILVSYDNSEGESTQSRDENDNLYWTVQAGKGLFFDLEGEGTGEITGAITLDVTYLDNGQNPIVITYTGGIHSKQELAEREDESVSIARTNTGKWRTRRISLPDVNLQNACKFRTDVRISGGNDSSVSIREVKIVRD